MRSPLVFETGARGLAAPSTVATVRLRTARNLRARSGRTRDQRPRLGNGVADVLEATRAEVCAFQLATGSCAPRPHSAGAVPFLPGLLSSVRRCGAGPSVPL